MPHRADNAPASQIARFYAPSVGVWHRMSKSRPKPPPLTATPSIGSRHGSASIILSARSIPWSARPRGSTLGQSAIRLAPGSMSTLVQEVRVSSLLAIRLPPRATGMQPCLIAVAISIVTIAKKTNNAMCYNELHKMKITKRMLWIVSA